MKLHLHKSNWLDLGRALASSRRITWEIDMQTLSRVAAALAIFAATVAVLVWASHDFLIGLGWACGIGMVTTPFVTLFRLSPQVWSYQGSSFWAREKPHGRYATWIRLKPLVPGLWLVDLKQRPMRLDDYGFYRLWSKNPTREAE